MSGRLAIDEAAWASPWRTRPVAEKLLLALGLVACAVVLPPWPGVVLAGVCALVALLMVARVPARLLARSLRAPLAFIAIGSLTVLVTVQLDDGLSLAITEQSVYDAVVLAGRALAGTLGVYLLAATTPMGDLLASMRRIGVPAACVEVASVTYRMVFTLLVSTRQIREAQAARLGYSGYRRSVHSAGGLTAATLVRSWDRARRLEEGLAGRGYDGTLPTLPRSQATSMPFVLLSAFVIVAVAGLGAWGGGQWGI
ncbi:cobalt ECF transporter T component CbiQ [Epidermidibacterium keratini]|uniref:Cobalt ECF transporter T component CbiQ n=1 Tax=Epidermidibacterium keratini TaxID=1891644 RepID=A0A7L4YKS8_9ACTN|nr:cobalt ECF transporter T component CbiQ [Epidermidibacterium keratini]QHB99860.1 cobalt ECF transporter T component CbiQ [Epidermidibacterium keratini]